MKRKIIGIFICMLLIAAAAPSFGIIIEPKSIADDNQVFCKEKILTNTETSVLPHETITIRHHLLKRTYLLYVPTSYDETTPVPLVLFFHGGPNTPENASGRFGISEKAEVEGFIVAYANASEMFADSWMLGYGFYTVSKFEEFGRIWVDEVGYIKKIIEKTQKDYNIDAKRIYLAGHSNGAMFAYLLATQFSDIIAAMSSNGGCIGGHLKDFDMYTIPEPANPVSIVIFHGKKDIVVPYAGSWDYSRTVFYKSVAEAVTFWVEQNGCTPDPDTNIIGNVTIDKYSGGEAGTEVLVYTIKNKGHIWFGGQPWEDPTPEISTTDKMWEFFEAHPKP